MTGTHSGPVLEADNAEQAVPLLRERGMRISAARRIVIEALYGADRPVTVEQIAAGMDGRLPVSDAASVYRNLEALERAGLVRHFHAGHSPGLYTVTSSRGREYLVCERCGHAREVEASELEPARAQIRERFGFEARFSHFPIVGLCAACASADPIGPDAAEQPV